MLLVGSFVRIKLARKPQTSYISARNIVAAMRQAVTTYSTTPRGHTVTTVACSFGTVRSLSSVPRILNTSVTVLLSKASRVMVVYVSVFAMAMSLIFVCEVESIAYNLASVAAAT